MTAHAIGFGVLLIAAARLAVAPPFVLPAPTGPHPVGSTGWHVVDSSRPEMFSPSGEPHQVEVQAWYPAADRGARPAPYLHAMAEAQSFAHLMRQPTVFDELAPVQTHATLEATPRGTPATRFPVLVFQHGYTGLPSSHTALAEDLASRGYAVLSIVHPYEATASTLADGRVVTFLGEKGTMRQQILDVLNEWGPESDTMTKVTAAADYAEKEKLLRGYLAALRKTDDVVRRWVLDTKLVLDRLPKTGPGSALAAKLDLARAGFLGHSMGGVASGQFCVEDRRCRAGLNLDGIPQYGTMIDTPMPAPFLMVYSGRAGRLGASDLIYKRSAARYYRVDVRDTLHLDFTDMNLWPGPLRGRGAFGAMPPERAADITRMIVREYFDQELLGKASPLLSGETRLPEVTVTRSARSK
jgi:predicted dienelactone hydrolase